MINNKSKLVINQNISKYLFIYNTLIVYYSKKRSKTSTILKIELQFITLLESVEKVIVSL